MSEKWEAFLLSDGAEVRGIDGSMIADIFAGYGVTGKVSFETSVEECHARAKLFAAAPDMLKELALAHTALVGVAYPEYVFIEDDAKHRLSEIDAVIERATGKKPLETYCDAIMAEDAAPDLKRERDEAVKILNRLVIDWDNGVSDMQMLDKALNSAVAFRMEHRIP